ncbi:serine/threonine-protein kinase polo [Sitodiplosis mosellana]|uniref:serine/threonine-protein kinase polo n=1 Tax=Sitodiplosis mosellana TaxID=263140 RepID=UPI002444FEFC|nr:serine/threonine-protein kinase polo [Sitodiplosis mosellana]
MSSKHEDPANEIPDILFDKKENVKYKRCRLFGKGGFARCYEIVDMKTQDVYAAKVVSKKLVMKHNQKDKMTQEIKIHQSLSHPNVVRFLSFFEDDRNVYIVLELCKQRSMMELHKRRPTVTVAECRFYIHQILEGVRYLHDNRIIHRDLKLGNLFLNDKLNVKIGDFGLAARIKFDGERKQTLCGTPNYIAPEILQKSGHSYEVDIWSIGCIMYTLLVGQPPFETKTLKDTYSKIRKCDYRMPQTLPKWPAEMICAMLQSDPTKRPSVHDLLRHEFLKHPIPKSLPVSCLTCEPRLDQLGYSENDLKDDRRPLIEINNEYDERATTFLRKNLHDQITAQCSVLKNNRDYKNDIDNLYLQLTKLLNDKPQRNNYNENLSDENTDPAAAPLFWVSKWVDYTDKYGFGYQLCDEGMGVMFNDTTKLIMLANGINVHYIDREGNEQYMTHSVYPDDLEKKMKLLSYFKRYMTEHLVKAGGNSVRDAGDVVSRIPHLHTWFRTTCAVVMHLTNGSVQLNFSDHIKIILCPRMSAVTYIDNKFRTYKFSTISKLGCSAELYQKLRYAHEKLKKLLEKLK